jgi:hypothetical protein
VGTGSVSSVSNDVKVWLSMLRVPWFIIVLFAFFWPAASATRPFREPDDQLHLHLVRAQAAEGECLAYASEGSHGDDCRRAVGEYDAVLMADPAQDWVLKHIGYLLYQTNQFEEADGRLRTYAVAHENDPEVLCALVAVGFRRCDLPGRIARVHVATANEFIDSASCLEIRATSQHQIDEGFKLLRHAMALRSGSADLAGYMSVYYWALARMQCGDHKAYAVYMRKAVRWGRVAARAAERRRAERTFPLCPVPPPPISSRRGKECHSCPKTASAPSPARL